MNPSDISRWQGSVNSWLGQKTVRGAASNPVNDEIMCDTTGLVAGYYDFVVSLVGSSYHYYAFIEHRNAINTVNLYEFYSIWGEGFVNSIYINNWKVAANERLRVKVINDSNDVLLATIYWTIRA